MLSGALFTETYLTRGMREQQGYAAAAALEPAFRTWLQDLLASIGDPGSLNEAQTEARIVRPLLDRLGWAGLWEAQNAVGRGDIPDYLLFPDADTYRTADHGQIRDKVRHAIAVADAKAWGIRLDHRGSGAGYNETPAGQVLRYMDRAAAQSVTCRWGVLTNGRRWRLSYQGAADRLGSFFEVDLLAALGADRDQVLPMFGVQVEPEHALTMFLMLFGQIGFGEVQRVALNEGKKWETGVRNDLAKTVFDEIYPGLIRALVTGDARKPVALTQTYLLEAREAALTLLYRLLFILYAEDRDLLPHRERRYRDYALDHLREEIRARIDGAGVFSSRSDALWRHARDLFRMIDAGDDSLGIPAYNGKLFAETRSPLLERSRLPDDVFAPLLDALSRRMENGERKRINYRDLSVRELGSIYERLLEYEPVSDATAEGGVKVRLNPFARKGSGSYYTPDVLVRLIIERTLKPLVDERLEAFRTAVNDNRDGRENADDRRTRLTQADPATAILSLKICDPAMGSGHFLVDLIDWLAAQVFTAIGQAEEDAKALDLDWRSPLAAELQSLRQQLAREAERHGWATKPDQLNDANLIRRLVLKRCAYGVDKNPMAVELAKVALWLHTFTAGAPLSFLDHHLRCGDSLFGEWVDDVLRETEADAKGKRRSLLSGIGMFLRPAIRRAASAEKEMRYIESLSDGVLSEVEQSADAYSNVESEIGPLKAFLDFRQALRWLKVDKRDEVALSALLADRFGPPLDILAGKADMIVPAELARMDGQIDLIEVETEPEQMSLLPGAPTARDYVRAKRIVDATRALAAEQHFLHWQVAFPGVWIGWEDARTGGFDAVIGNPPWDRMKMQEVEWFAERAPAIAKQVRASDRKAAIEHLRADGDPLAAAYDLARTRAERGMEVARTSGAFPLLSRGDINIYALFVERAQALIRPDGAAGLLTPSGIASDLTAAAFFKSLSTAGRVLTLFDFENRRGGGREHFFPDVDSRFKFCAFIAGGAARTAEAAECAFFLQDAPAIDDPRLFHMTAADFARVNPNTGTAPIFRSAKDAEITRAIYSRLPVLVDRSSGEEVKAWPVKYLRMFDMTNDSHLFWTKARLEKEGAYPVGAGRWAKGDREWLPLYSGRMIQHYNSRAAGVELNEENVHNAALSDQSDNALLRDLDFFPEPQYRVEQTSVVWPYSSKWGFSFRDIARSTDVRTAIGAIVGRAAFGNKAPLVVSVSEEWTREGPLFASCFLSLPFDYVCRSKVMSTSLNWFTVEQLPVVPVEAFKRQFGRTTAADIVRDHVLRLSYTAHDLADFARDMGHVDPTTGEVKPPFRWDETERRHLRARLDALYFILYGVTDPADVDHILSTFPIVERKDRAAHGGVYLTRQLIRWYMRALQAGDTERVAPEAELIAAAGRRRAA